MGRQGCQSQAHSSFAHASRPSFTKNQTIASEPNASTHQTPSTPCPTRLTTTTRDSQPQVMLHGVGPQSAAPESVGKGDPTPRKIAHENGKDADQKAGD